MKKCLELSLMMITGLLVSCAGEGYLGPPGPGGWGSRRYRGKIRIRNGGKNV